MPSSIPHFTFQLLRAADLPLLHEWLHRPHVAERWGLPGTMEELREEFFPSDPDPRDARYLAYLEGRPIAYIQSYWAIDSGNGWWVGQHDASIRGIDQFIAEADHLGRGLGTELVRQFTAALFEDPGVTVVQVDPTPDNARAIRCYEKAGFKRVGLAETPDGQALLLQIRRPGTAPVAD
jgi:aminoglycoside 6'-N-acetyltransferase Ib